MKCCGGDGDASGQRHRLLSDFISPEDTTSTFCLMKGLV